MMRTVNCKECGAGFSAEEITVAEGLLSLHSKIHAGDGFSSADTVELLDELKACQTFFEGIIGDPKQSALLRKQAEARKDSIKGLLS